MSNNKSYAQLMRDIAKADNNGILQVSTALWENLIDIIENSVEVVRCRDCKHFTKGMAIGMCKRIEDKPITPMPYNNYCGFGERRCDDENS